METPGPELEVRLTVRQCVGALSSPRDASELTQSLRTLGSYLDETGERCPASERQEFARGHYTRVLQFLVSNLQVDWQQLLSPTQHAELWGSLFLRGPPDQALLVLLDCVSSSRPSSGLDRVLDVLERFLQGGRLNVLLWERCQGPPPPESPQLREAILGRLVSLPDIMANCLQHQNRTAFLPPSYYPLLAREMSTALEKTCQALRGGQDCSVTFLAQLLGKACVQGHSERLLTELVPRLSSLTRADMVWQRVCWRLLESVPDRWMEAVVTGLVQAVDGPGALSRILGNVVVKNKKTQFVLTHKLLLLQYKYKTPVLRSLLGYLSQDTERRPLLIQVLRALCEAWSGGSAVRHAPLEQQLYLSRALLLSVGLLSDPELLGLRAELLQCMLGGMQCHLDSSVERVRRLGMVVGESLSTRLDPEGSRLQFQYEQDAETRELRSLVFPPPANQPVSEDTPHDRAASPQSGPGTDLKGREKTDLEPVARLTSKVPRPIADQRSDSELDSDDELPPYDMSADQELSGAPPPRYLRDCLEALATSEDPGKMEVSLQAAEGLIRRNAGTVAEVSVQLVKVLLHLEDRYTTPGFLWLRQRSMVAVTVSDPLPVTEFLTSEFFALNYSLRQRLDILEVLALSAQELSEPTPGKDRPSPRIQSIATTAPLDPCGSSPLHWRRVVEQRIESKTRRFGKARPSPPQLGYNSHSTRPAVSAAPNRFAPVAGHFFFPLLRNYDRPLNTFDLLGSDHLVLGRLIHTLGLLMHLAVNAPVATQMGRALLDFVWAVRYHVDPVVRQGVLFSVCAVFLSMPSRHLLSELSDHLLETRAWLGGE
ncbi:TELO2 protein, partial [Amia calva]|nr:TELO2 protein [Amia calva]